MTATRLLKLPGICLLFLLVDLVSSWTLWGFNRINYTTLDQCIVGAPFLITGRDLDANHRDVPHVQFASSISSHVVDGPCSYYGLEKTTLRCDIPYSKQWDYDAWYSVKVIENGVLGTPITPGIRVTAYNSTGPKIDSVSVTCHPYGCDERVTYAGTSMTREPWSDLCISFVFVVALVIAWKESQRQPDQKNDMSENDVLILPESYVVMKSQHVCSSGLIETVASSESALGALNQQEAYPSLYVHCPQQATDVSPDPAFVYQTPYYQAPHYQASTDAQHQVIFSSCTIPA